VELAAPENQPTTQLVHAEAAEVLENFPAAHTPHTVEAAAPTKLPRPQAVHTVELAALENQATTQLVHTETPAVLEYFPVVHTPQYVELVVPAKLPGSQTVHPVKLPALAN
jgi:hypothetical protein